MKIMIDIPKEQYDMILLSDNNAMAECVSKEAMMYAIKNGVPLIEADKGDSEQNRCGNCKEFGTVSCAETYREPTENDEPCECYKGE